MYLVGGDRACGALIEETWVVLHDTAEDCCAEEYSWIDNELCATRTTHSTLSKYWADKTNGKCEDDSVYPTTDLSVAIYDSIENCCSKGLPWLTEGACLSASGMDLTGAGSNKFYVDYVSQHCAKDCDGPRNNGTSCTSQRMIAVLRFGGSPDQIV